MDADAFDRLSRSISALGTRRRLLRLLTGLPLAGLVAITGDETEAARGRKAHRNHDKQQQQREHHHTKTQRRKQRDQDTHSEACIPTGQRCPAKKARGNKGSKLSCARCCQGVATTDGSGKRVCSCQTNGGTCTPATAATCCSGICVAGTCQSSASCVPPCPPCQTCNSAGQCETVTDGAPCNDGDACTQTDTCQGGTCVGSNPVGCTPLDQCHDAGVCDPGTGTCSNPAKPDGATCDDGNVCLTGEACQAGVCNGGTPVADGTPCGGGNVCCSGDCQACCSDADCFDPTPICQDHVCVACTSSAQCPTNQICLLSGVCHTCDVTCPSGNSPLDCGAALQLKIDVSISGATIHVCPGIYQGTFLPNVAMNLIGAGEGSDPANNTILDADGAGTVLTTTSHVSEMGLQRLRVTGGKFSGGGGIAIGGTMVQMTECTVVGNISNDSRGGGISIGPLSTLEMTRCTIRNNHATGTPGLGGGIAAGGGSVTLTDCLVEANSANSNGGGLYISGAMFTLAGSTEVRGNFAVGQEFSAGGGIYLNGPSSTADIAETCLVTHNTATLGSGGGIHNNSGGVTLQGTDPSPIVINNCHTNCAGISVDKCRPLPVSC